MVDKRASNLKGFPSSDVTILSLLFNWVAPIYQGAADVREWIFCRSETIVQKFVRVTLIKNEDLSILQKGNVKVCGGIILLYIPRNIFSCDGFLVACLWFWGM